MYRNYKIVVNTAAGRRRYMQYLVPFIVASDVVDRYDIWVNTHNGADIEFFKRIAAKYPKINLVWQPDGVVNGIRSINAFYKQCVDEDTIYFKMDDDIVWMEDDTIQKMVDFRIDNPHYFVVSPLVINNSLSTYLLQVNDKIKLNLYFNSNANHAILWKSGDFAYQLHDHFLEKWLKPAKWEQLHLGKREMGMTRFSINSILWFGKDLKKINGIVPGDDEEFMSCIYPTKLGVANCWNGDTIMAHFAFFTQREQLDSGRILERYGEYLHQEWSKNPKMSEIDSTIQSIINDIDKNETTLMALPSPYKKVDSKINSPIAIKAKIGRMIKKHLPTFYSSITRTYRKNISYIN